MARLNFTPFFVLAFIGLLALLGDNIKAFNDDPYAYCAYELAQKETPPPNVLIVGMSRTGWGVDPGYMMSRIFSDSNKKKTIERLALTSTKYPQFRPVLTRYIAQRGAPKHVFLQLSFNFRPERQRSWDFPINTIRNVMNASMTELLEIRKDAKPNHYNTLLPRRYEEDYLSLPALVLQKVELAFYNAMRYIPIRMLGKLEICDGDAIFRQANPRWLYNQLEDTLTFHESASQKRKREDNAEIAAGFLPLSPTSSFRRFEVDQLLHLIDMLESAGSTVHLLLMPRLGDTSLTPKEAGEIAAVFPNNELIHPYSLFETELGFDLAKSFVDTHHATRYGALLYSRYFADVISGMDF